MASSQTVLRTVNRVVEPAVRAGVGNAIAGPGLFVLETTGRRSGLTRRVPLVGARLGDTIVVSTIRAKSEWVRNLEHDAAAGVWLGGRRRPVRASVTRRRGTTVARLALASTC